ncbi:hypothetical protein SCUCBS95973_006839 [Sporothrix curviconia]|uniref:Uncharacterized protein n=1 Tax=Sporothrix curviconia TaxID=1260050 RepID=A0ABP0C8I3_9PEZI
MAAPPAAPLVAPLPIRQRVAPHLRNFVLPEIPAYRPRPATVATAPPTVVPLITAAAPPFGDDDDEEMADFFNNGNHDDNDDNNGDLNGGDA